MTPESRGIRADSCMLCIVIDVLDGGGLNVDVGALRSWGMCQTQAEGPLLLLLSSYLLSQ
jgi:hypothetical protein